MTQKQDCALIAASPDAIEQLFCSYEHHMVFTPGDPPTLVFVHACKLTDVYLMREARSNTDWVLLAEQNYPLIINVTNTFDSLADAINHVQRQVKAMPAPPRCNLHGYNMASMRRIIVCSDGREFGNQSEAARAIGVSQSAISQHMKSKTSTVKGYKLAYKTTGSGR